VTLVKYRKSEDGNRRASTTIGSAGSSSNSSLSPADDPRRAQRDVRGDAPAADPAVFNLRRYGSHAETGERHVHVPRVEKTRF